MLEPHEKEQLENIRRIAERGLTQATNLFYGGKKVCELDLARSIDIWHHLIDELKRLKIG